MNLEEEESTCAPNYNANFQSHEQIVQEFNKLKTNSINPDLMFAVSRIWFNQFIHSNPPNVGQIDNYNLIKDRSKYIGELPVIKSKLKNELDYVLVSKAQWELLYNHFEGGPEIVFEKINQYPLKYESQSKLMNVVIMKDLADNRVESNIKKLVYENSDKLKDLLSRITHYLTIDHTEVRMWKPNFGYNLMGFQKKINDYMAGQSKSTNPIKFPGDQLNPYFEQLMSEFQTSKQAVKGPELLVFEVSIHENKNFIFDYDQNDYKIGNCPGCFQMKILKVFCECKKISYCDQECKKKNLYWHQPKCTFSNNLDVKSFVVPKKHAQALQGKVGLHNLGNTCYLNSAVQCLSNLRLLREYLFSEKMPEEINLENTKFSSNGNLVVRFTELLAQMWHSVEQSVIPVKLKQVIGQYLSQFGNSQQHDSSEFLGQFLDKIHEDLNRVKQKPYIEIPELQGNDYLLSQVWWTAYLMRNQSIIVDLFSGQYRSTLKCPKCNYSKITFDSFTSVSLPIPPFYWFQYFFIPAMPREKNANFKIKFQQISGNIETILSLVKFQAQKYYDREIGEVVFASVGRDSLKLVCLHEQSQTKIQFLLQMQNSANCFTFVYEIEPEQQFQQEQTILVQLQMLHTRLPQNQYDGQGTEEKLLPQLRRFSLTQTLGEIQFNILSHFQQITGYDFQPRLNYISTNSQGQCLICSHYNCKNCVLPNTEQLLYQFLDNFGYPFQTLQQGQSLYSIQFNNLEHITQEGLQIFGLQLHFVTFEQQSEDWSQFCKLILDCDYNTLPQTTNQTGINLQQCFKQFRGLEKLSAENNWTCVECKESVQATKQLELFSSGPYIIFTLNRFKHFNQYQPGKIVEMITYPITDLDLSTLVFEKSNQCKHKDKMLYNLCGVINHYGNMENGHYTATCLNEDGFWYSYDDSIVSQLSSPDQIVTQNAYVLFYQRKDTIGQTASNLQQKKQLEDPIQFAIATKIIRHKSQAQQQQPKQETSSLLQEVKGVSEESKEESKFQFSQTTVHQVHSDQLLNDHAIAQALSMHDENSETPYFGCDQKAPEDVEMDN